MTEETRKHNTMKVLRDRLDLSDFFSLKVWRASVSELFGTALLVFMINTIIISSNDTTEDPKLMMSILISFTVAILVLATIPVSGGHINPTVTLAAALMGLISFSRATIYIIAQCVGGTLGALALTVVLSKNIDYQYSFGGCTVTVIESGLGGPVQIGLNTSEALCLEFLCSFSFLFASRWIAFDPRQSKLVGRVMVCSAIGLAAGLNLFVSKTITGIKGYSGAGMNAARCLGPAIVKGGHLWDGHWVFWLGPCAASMVFYLYTKIIPEEHFQPNETKHDLFDTLKDIVRVSDDDSSKHLDRQNTIGQNLVP